ncbi:laccase, multicopper oxidase, benzenediol:oxygen oxidorectuctase, partial [Serendipita sp. 399]
MNLLNSVIFLVSLSLSSQAVDRNYVFNVANADLAPDGFTRSTVVVNNQFPGPLITANKGDTINVLVNNNLTSTSMRRSTTIHWHGLFQHRNAHHDGPAFVTQCPISPDHSYTYAIPPSNQTGTYWYHSHLSSQYLDGLRGPIVINPEDPHRGLYDVDDESTVIVLADWFHAASHELLAAYTSPMNTAGNEQLPQSGTING